MSLYPTTPLPSAPCNWSSVRPVTRSVFLGRIVSRPDTHFDLFKISLNYMFPGGWSEAKILLDFWTAVQGGHGVFTFRDFGSRAWSGLYVGVGNGSQTAFNLPVTSGTGHQLFKDGVPASATITTDGTDGRDKATFSPAPAAGVLVTVSFDTGYRTCDARFVGDEFPITDPIGPYYLSGTIQLTEVRS